MEGRIRIHHRVAVRTEGIPPREESRRRDGSPVGPCTDVQPFSRCRVNADNEKRQMKVFFDTSVLVAAQVESHPVHSRALAWLKKVLQDPAAKYFSGGAVYDALAPSVAAREKGGGVADTEPREFRPRLVRGGFGDTGAVALIGSLI
jgi:hypothetical protein